MRSLKGFLAVVVTNLIFVLPAMAEEAAVTGGTSWGTKYIGLGIAVIGGALGQGKTAAAALEGISRNPGASGQMFLPMILGLALIESLVLLAFLIAGGLI